MQSVDSVRHRLLRTAATLRRAGVPYAIVGGNAVALWVSRVDAEAVRTTRDVDVLLRRSDLATARKAMEANGFRHVVVAGADMFLDGEHGSPRSAVHIVFADEKVRDHEMHAAPGVHESEETEFFRVVALDALVRMKLTAHRDHDRTHLRDLAAVGLIDATWSDRLPPPLGERLRAILAEPDG